MIRCLRIIPVVILTTSHREEDVLQTYLAGANTYIPKPAEYPSYRELVATLRHYWVDTALKVPYQLRRKLAAEAARLRRSPFRGLSVFDPRLTVDLPASLSERRCLPA